jgi:hypothetical protein
MDARNKSRHDENLKVSAGFIASPAFAREATEKVESFEKLTA